MLHARIPKLEDMIVLALASHPSMTAQGLSDHIASRFRRFTIQAVYQELRKLQSQLVVTKVRERYMLRVAWVLEMGHLADRMHNSYLQQGALAALLPGRGEKVRWQIHSISRLTTFWSQVNLALVAESRGHTLFEYLPHVWFHLAAGPDEHQFLRGLQLAGTPYRCVVGEESYLDRLYQRLGGGYGAILRFGQCPFQSAVDRYCGSIGEFLVTVRLNKTISSEIERVYTATRSARDVSVGQLNDLFNRKESATLTLERGTVSALRVQKQFKEFFGN